MVQARISQQAIAWINRIRWINQLIKLQLRLQLHRLHLLRPQRRRAKATELFKTLPVLSLISHPSAILPPWTKPMEQEAAKPLTRKEAPTSSKDLC